ncbi:YncE family protein [Actinomadura welshii]
MKPETMIESTLGEWADEARVPAGLADRALHRNTRRRRIRIAAFGGTSALLAGATAVALISGGVSEGPARPDVVFEPVALSSDTTLRTDLDNGFPERLVAAGRTAVAAYYTGNRPMGAMGTLRRTWHLYNPSTGTYEKTDWAYLDVAPGMQRAAVLKGPLPASRVGVFDMKTRKVTHWIRVEKPVAGLSWSPDGRKLLLTSYSSNPDTTPEPYKRPKNLETRHDPNAPKGPPKSPRTGYYVVNSKAEPSRFHALPGSPDNFNLRQDMEWSRDGTLVWTRPSDSKQKKVFYDLNGKQRPAPANEAELGQEASLSPNGKLLAGGKLPSRPPGVSVTSVDNGREVAVLPIQQALAWADNSRLFAIGCEAKKCKGKNEFRNRLLLITLKGRITPLTGYQRSDRAGSWTPVFTHR